VTCPDRVETLGTAREAVEVVDIELAEALLGQLLISFGCGAVATRDEVAEYFLLEGALASYRGDDDGLREAFRSASAVSEYFWLASLGAAMQERFVAARETSPEMGKVRFEPLLDGHALFVDGTPWGDPALVNVTEGLHLLQVGEGERVVFAAVVSVPAGGQHVVEHELQPWRPPTSGEGEVIDTKPAPREAVALHLATGLAFGVGGALEGQTGAGLARESAQKLFVPVEVGVVVHRGGAFVRAAGSAAPSLTGDLLYGTDNGGRASRLSLGGHVAGGATLGAFEIGALSGPSWPGRWQVRAIGGLALPGPMRVELRAGANAVTQRSPEPAFDVLFVVQPEF
jgi:hypothetical protein